MVDDGSKDKTTEVICLHFLSVQILQTFPFSVQNISKQIPIEIFRDVLPGCDAVQ